MVYFVYGPLLLLTTRANRRCTQPVTLLFGKTSQAAALPHFLIRIFYCAPLGKGTKIGAAAAAGRAAAAEAPTGLLLARAAASRKRGGRSGPARCFGESE